MNRLLLITVLFVEQLAFGVNFYTSFNDGTVGNLVDVTNLTRSTISEAAGWYWHDQNLQKTYISNSTASFNGGGFTVCSNAADLFRISTTPSAQPISSTSRFTATSQ